MTMSISYPPKSTKDVIYFPFLKHSNAEKIFWLYSFDGITDLNHLCKDFILIFKSIKRKEIFIEEIIKGFEEQSNMLWKTIEEGIDVLNKEKLILSNNLNDEIFPKFLYSELSKFSKNGELFAKKLSHTLYYHSIENEFNYFLNILIIFLLEIKNFLVSSNSFFCAPNSEVVKFYKNKNDDILEMDKNFDKYQLITLDLSKNKSRFSIFDQTQFTKFIFDSVYSIYIELFLSSDDLFLLFKNLSDLGLIKNVSIRPDFTKIYDEPRDIFPDLEFRNPVNIGSRLNNLIKDFWVEKRYNIEYSDILWIYSTPVEDDLNKINLTFEEIPLLEKPIFYNLPDKIRTTQVIHLVIAMENNQLVINHIDHEYIFYSEEQIELRQENHKIKGTKIPRCKTFKIDDAKIPFSLHLDDQIINPLEIILKEFIINIDLVDEFLNDSFESFDSFKDFLVKEISKP